LIGRRQVGYRISFDGLGTASAGVDEAAWKGWLVLTYPKKIGNGGGCRTHARTASFD